MQLILNVLPLAAVTPLGLLATFTWLVVGGKLVPRSWVDKAAADAAAEIAFLRKANADQGGTITSLVTQNAELSVSGRLSVALLQTLPTATTTNHSVGLDPGSGHVPSIEKD